MPRDPLFPDTTPPLRTRSPELGGGNERKRRRKVLSCYDCRRRKLQCDRAQPACSRCTKNGQAASCRYIDDPSDASPRNADESEYAAKDLDGDGPPGRALAPTLSSDTLTRLEYQDKRIRELESALAHSIQSQFSAQKPHRKLPLTPDSMILMDTSPAVVNATDRETMLLRGKSFKTQFHGISHPGSIIAYIPELSPFTKEILSNFPGLSRIRHYIHALEDGADRSALQHQITTEHDLRALLPPKREADELVRLYFDSLGNVYHIVHSPSFWKEYSSMWDDISTTRAHFVALVLLMIACVQCQGSLDPWLYSATGSVMRDKALIINRVCEDWLITQSQKHVTAIDFQIRFLLNLSRLLNASKFKRTWTDAGSFLRFSMAAGLHRDPDLLRKSTSALDKEMRRRIWLAAADFELESSFARGMLATPWPQQSDYVPPSNIVDEDFDDSSVTLPTRRSRSEFTAASFLTTANETFMLRYTLNAVLNNVREQITFDEVKRYTEEIETHLQSVPKWSEAESQLPQALLGITLRNYLLVLHDRQIRQSDSVVERSFSRMVLINAAKKIMDDHVSLLDKGYTTLLFLRHDQMRAAFSACLAYSMSSPEADGILHSFVEDSAARVVSDVVEVITRKAERLGCELRQLWMVLAADSFMKTKKDPSQKLVYMQESVDKVLRQFYKILACQEDAPSLVSSGPPTGRDDLPGVAEYLPLAEPQKPDVGVVNDPTLLDFDMLASMTFDDWILNPADVPAFETGY
ncbi:hypothetical protein BDY17DRAFT_323369 [Neohortaea acidophila]|uniref:Zn(2)-C6 fungal-type domain-containing protein n=1 Tax=Neohortaea acidophila TaxID=245834 RepID=A0A6A6PXR2_9PEZI|nr:uncharacterized protein BDY17DRAFT_323369 [Neohortaea acidophila]KAF2484524.1 hypothetical protein BDY17DRAFT_323369 [Neohortaea acidophila]